VAGKEWDRAVRERALALDGDLAAFEHFQRIGWNSFQDPEPDPVDKPDTLFDQLKWLEAAGLEEVDVFWMRAGHVVFGGTKPAPGSGSGGR
jgi:tRNA (cmo5U34)-methyltransferase